MPSAAARTPGNSRSALQRGEDRSSRFGRIFFDKREVDFGDEIARRDESGIESARLRARRGKTIPR